MKGASDLSALITHLSGRRREKLYKAFRDWGWDRASGVCHRAWPVCHVHSTAASEGVSEKLFWDTQFLMPLELPPMVFQRRIWKYDV